MKASRSEFVQIHGLRIHVRRWGTPGAPRLFLVHGSWDCSASFQFLVDAFTREWDIIAPDLRGLGLSQWINDSYWCSDHIADLDCLFDIYSQGKPAFVVGHSMGATICSMFAGMRPQHVSHLVFLDGYGIPPQDPKMRPREFAKWLEAKKNGVKPNRTYADKADFAMRLRALNPRLTTERTEFLAANFTCEDSAGKVSAAADPWHRIMYPCIMNIEDLKHLWRQVTAPLLWVAGADSGVYIRFATRRNEYQDRLSCFRDVQEVIVQDAGHNLHHDRPEEIAVLIEQFYAGAEAV